MHLRISSAKWRAFCLDLNVLKSYTLLWHHNEHRGISNHQPYDCLLNRLFRHRSKKTSKLCVTGLCEGNSLVTSEFPAQRASNAENYSIWWCHHDKSLKYNCPYLSCWQMPSSPPWSPYYMKSHDAHILCVSITFMSLHPYSLWCWDRSYHPSCNICILTQS